MNQSRSIYKTDFVHYEWMQNNCSSNSDCFCSGDNIDDCLQFLSQEFCALGYPPIYVNSDVCPYAVNCDIVNLLNAAFDLLGSSKDHTQSKDDLECRNHRLSSDLNNAYKKNLQLKENAEQVERKYRSVLERERQLKEKIDRLQQAIKTEKDEVKKLTSQMQQQKVAHQHEVRKSESRMNQMKNRLKQVLSDKNPDKKVASVSSSSLLQRTSKERGKWQTGNVAKSSVEDMYNSLISSYESRCHDMQKDVTDFQHCLECIETEMLKLIAEFKDDKETVISDKVPLCMLWNVPNKIKQLEERFKSLLSEIKESASKHIENSLQKCEELLKSKLSECEKSLQESITPGQITSNKTLDEEECSKRPDASSGDQENQTVGIKLEKEKLGKEKLQLCATITLIEKEKANLETQRLDFIKMAMQQNVPGDSWVQDLKSIPSFSVITTKDNVTAVPTVGQLKQSLSEPDQQVKTLNPLWSLGQSKTSQSRSEGKLKNSSTHESAPSSKEDIQSDIAFSSDELPKWAASSIDSFSEPSGSHIVLSDSISNEDLELSNISSLEDQDLSLLKAAISDIESRRKLPSS